MNKTISRSLVGMMVVALLFTNCKKSNNDEIALVVKYLLGRHYENLDRIIKFTVEVYGFKYEGTSGNHIDDEILLFGAYEKHLIFLMRDIIKNISPNEGIYVDVGANTGHHSMFMSQFAKQVYAFDPYEPVLIRFRNMLELNKIKNVKIFPVGLGDKEQMLTFYAPPEDNQGLGTFVNDRWKDTKKFHKLPIKRGDDFFKENNITKINILKVDIEGYEKVALKGLKKTLDEYRPVVIFEMNVEGNEKISSTEELMNLFPKKYKVLEIWGDLRTGNYILKPYDYKFDVTKNIIAYPDSKEKYIPLNLIVKSIKQLRAMKK